MSEKADIALIGLAIMGQNLILNMDSHGFVVCVYNRTVDKMEPDQNIVENTTLCLLGGRWHIDIACSVRSTWGFHPKDFKGSASEVGVRPRVDCPLNSILTKRFWPNSVPTVKQEKAAARAPAYTLFNSNIFKGVLLSAAVSVVDLEILKNFWK